MTVMCHWVGWLLESGNVSTMIDRMRMDMEREKKIQKGRREKGVEKNEYIACGKYRYRVAS